jgi:tetratricopeptide (TPR) repeat protein
MVDGDPMPREERRAIKHLVREQLGPAKERSAAPDGTPCIAAGGTAGALARLLAAERWPTPPASLNQLTVEVGALDGLARAQEGKGDLEAAAKGWEKAAAIPFYKDRATLERARVLAKAGKTDEAKKALESIPKESPVAGEAQARLSRLGAK